MSRLFAVAAVLAMFVAGIAVGALGTHIFYDRHLVHDGPPPPHPGMHGRRMADHLLDNLHLTPEQQKMVEEILDRTHEQAAELRHDVQPRIHALMDRAHDEIEGILSPEQREEFRRLIERQRRRAERFLLGPPGDRGRGRDE